MEGLSFLEIGPGAASGLAVSLKPAKQKESSGPRTHSTRSERRITELSKIL
jgi:hypothetical protein